MSLWTALSICGTTHVQLTFALNPCTDNSDVIVSPTPTHSEIWYDGQAALWLCFPLFVCSMYVNDVCVCLYMFACMMCGCVFVHMMNLLCVCVSTWMWKSQYGLCCGFLPSILFEKEPPIASPCICQASWHENLMEFCCSYLPSLCSSSGITAVCYSAQVWSF